MSNAVQTALYSKLTAGTALVAALGGTAIYNSIVPKTADVPYVVYHLASGREENLTPHNSQRYVFAVQAVAATLLQAGTIAALVHTLLHQQTLTVTGGTNFWTARETIIEYQEVESTGNTLGHAGGEYAIRVQA